MELEFGIPVVHGRTGTNNFILFANWCVLYFTVITRNYYLTTDYFPFPKTNHLPFFKRPTGSDGGERTLNLQF